ncbi:hypothetical protein HYC85_016071 [Camellia sinensis]|uniref:Glucan endo-1,3-beta-D-glucosidase n=1 Tax=Camellia sinensis TaxID=4442 RepID=A0A7J7GYJ0_CAMSI|nr:hypothetical protein HYC85_016071 [Camellia sinensis]
MKIWCSFGRFILAISILFTPKVLLAVEAFTGTYGINYGRIADNIPSPDKVITLLRAAKIKNVRIFDFDHSVLQAFSGTGLELVVGLPNGYVKDMSSNPDHALTWVKENVQAYLPETHIRGIAVGNEVLGGTDQSLFESLLGAVKNIYNATKELQLDKVVQISTAHSEAVFNNSYPPSSCTFKESIAQYMKPLLEFFSQTGQLREYMIRKHDLHYDNMLDAEIDAAYTALEDAGYKKMEVIVTETGWASDGDQNEAAATVSNARTYNYNLRKRLAKRKGTPRRPKSVLKVYVFAMFNEDSKPGPASERNFGLFKADGNISYDIGFAGLKSSSATSFFLSLKDIQAQEVIRKQTLEMAQKEVGNVRVDPLGDDDAEELAARYRTETRMVGVGEPVGQSQASALIVAPRPISQVEPDQWHTKADKSTITAADLEAIREKYQIPAEVELLLPTSRERPSDAKPGEFSLYEEALKGGLRLPLPQVVVDVLNRLEVAPRQLMPNAWKILLACASAWPKANGGEAMAVDEFFSCYKASGQQETWVTLQAVMGRGLVAGLPTSIKGWQPRWFYVSANE